MLIPARLQSIIKGFITKKNKHAAQVIIEKLFDMRVTTRKRERAHKRIIEKSSSQMFNGSLQLYSTYSNDSHSMIVNPAIDNRNPIRTTSIRALLLNISSHFKL